MKCSICLYPSETILCDRCKKSYVFDKTLGRDWIRKKRSKGSSKTQHRIFSIIKKWYPDARENVYPVWSIGGRGARLEYDILIPSIRLAVEVQGPTHWKFVPGYHRTQKDFKDQIIRDAEKIILATAADYTLFHLYLPTKMSQEELKVCLESYQQSCSSQALSSLVSSTTRQNNTIKPKSIAYRAHSPYLTKKSGITKEKPDSLKQTYSKLGH